MYVPSASKNEIIMSIGMPEETSRLNPLCGTNLRVAKKGNIGSIFGKTYYLDTYKVPSSF
jgi:hypothetical protein